MQGQKRIMENQIEKTREDEMDTGFRGLGLGGIMGRGVAFPVEALQKKG